MSPTMDKLRQAAISLVPAGAVVKIECMGETLTVGEHGQAPAPAVDLRTIMSKLLDEVPAGVVVNLTTIEPRPLIEDGICTGCGQPTERQVPCPRGDKCRFVFCDCSPCQCGNEPIENDHDDQ